MIAEKANPSPPEKKKEDPPPPPPVQDDESYKRDYDPKKKQER